MGVQSSGVPFVLRCADVESTSGPLRGGLLGYGVCVCAFVCVCVCVPLDRVRGRCRRQTAAAARAASAQSQARSGSEINLRPAQRESEFRGTSIGCDGGTPAPSAARRSAMRRRR